MGSDSPQQEATQLLSRVLRALGTRDHDLELVLQDCYLACVLLRWDADRDWFYRERAGYPADAAIPAYRRVAGTVVWRMPGEAMVLALEVEIAEQRGYRRKQTEEPTSLDVKAGVVVIRQAAQSGYNEWTDETKTDSTRSGQEFTWRRQREFDASGFARMLAEISRLTYDWAAKAYSQLQYGDALTDIWTGYRTDVDRVLHALGFEGHLRAIESGLRSGNPEEWRKSVYECRGILEDLSKHLWRDPRKTYDLIKPAGRASLEVDRARSDRFANRLSAYLHQKMVREKNRKLVERQLDYLHAPISALAAWQGEAHAGLSREDARSVALATYFIVGELVTKTDMQPIETWVDPSQSMQPGAEPNSTG